MNTWPNRLNIWLFSMLALSSCTYPQPSAVNYKPAILQKNDRITAEKVRSGYASASTVPSSFMFKSPYTSVKKTRTLTGIAAVNAANQKAQLAPSSSQYINAIMNFNYVEGALYQIYCAPLYVTDIQFQQNEHIVSTAAGDTLRWQVSRTYSGEGNSRCEHLLVKPIEEGLTNTLVVTTDQRTYHLWLHSTSRTYMASVQWRYPDTDNFVKNFDSSSYRGFGSALPSSLGRNVDINQLDFNYDVQLVSGSQVPNWMPKMVFNDGRKTYVQFPKNMQEAPTLFVGTSVGNGRVVNYRVDGDYYIVDGVITQAQLRLGQLQQVVVQITKQET